RARSDLLLEKLGLAHPRADSLRVALIRGAPAARMPLSRPGEPRGELCRLRFVEVRGQLAEVGLRCLAHAVHPGAELDHVEVQLDDAPLGQRALELPGEGLPP